MALHLFHILVLSLFWVALSGILDAFHIGVGILSALIIYLLDIRTDPKPSKAAPGILGIIRRFAGTLFYSAWLLSRIFLAALHVSKIILSGKMNLDAKFIEHRTILSGDIQKTLFANSITLTPGTITVDIEEGGKYIVHQLDEDSSGDIRSNAMEKQIQKIFGAPQ